MSCPFRHLHPNSAQPTSAAANDRNDNGSKVNNLLTFMQGSPDAAFLVDHEGKVVYRNKAAQLMFLTNVHQMSLCSIFSFAQSDCWDQLVEGLSASEPEHHDVTVVENDGSSLAFRLNLVKLPPELMGDENSEVFACAYVTPAHDYDSQKGARNRKLHSISEDDATNEEQLHGHMKDVVQASLDPMFSVHENGTIILGNDAAVTLFGHSHKELEGMDIASICKSARELQQILSFIHAPSINKQQITSATAKDGKKLCIELGLSLNTSFAGSDEPVYFAHLKDISQMEEHKSEIEHKDNLCQAMINASFDPMFGIDQRGKIMVVNEAACQAFGYSREEFLGNNISMICNERDAVDHDKHLYRYVSTGEKRVIGRKRPLVARRKDGTEFHIELGVSEVSLSNGEKMFCGYVRDRTQERLDKQMLRRKDAVIQDKFFQMDPADARGALKKNVVRFTQ